MPIPYPSELTFERWVSELIDLAYDSAIELPRAPPEDDWRTWVERISEFAELDVPKHDGFETWQAWAERFVEFNDDVIG